MITYRPLKKTDLKTAAKIYEQAFDEPWGEAALLDLFSMKGGYGFMADIKLDGGLRPVGFVLARSLFEDAEILTIAVGPEHQGKGVALGLMSLSHQQAINMGAEKMFLEVAADNVAAQGLYDKLGYVELSIRKKYYRRAGGGRIDAYNLVKDFKS